MWIVTIQLTGDENSKLYLDYGSENEGLQGIFQLYEEILKGRNPLMNKLVYSLTSVIQFIDQLESIVILKFDDKDKGFKIHGKQWLKSLLLANAIKDKSGFGVE